MPVRGVEGAKPLAFEVSEANGTSAGSIKCKTLYKIYRDTNAMKGADYMASAKFEGGKYHGATEAKAHMRHDDITPEARAVAAINNPHIDVTKSHLNKSLLGLTYEQMCEKYDNRIAQLDNTTNRNKRKDRVTLQNIEVPVPAGLDKKLYNKWFCRVGEILCDAYGRDNLIDAQIHYDEEHEYVDAETHEKRMSRVHMHASIVPEVNGVLNCKRMSGRANMRKLNNAIEKMTQQQFGCSFMTGTKKRSRESLDELKYKSAQIALQQREQNCEQREQNCEQREQNCEQREQAVAEAQNSLLQRENKVIEREQAVDEKQADLLKYEQLGIQYYSRAKALCSNLGREDKEFRDNKAKLYSQSLNRIDNLRTKLDESLLPQPHRSKQKERSL